MQVTPEQIRKAKEIDLLTYLQTNEPDNLKKIGRETYCTKEHDSLKISNGLWHWFSRDIGGKTALDYLIKVKGFSFVEAVIVLAADTFVPKKPIVYPERIKPFRMPNLFSDIQKVKKYLLSRGIDESLVDYCHETGILYEDNKYHNCVFLGRDEKGVPQYGTIRSTDTTFKRELDGSNKEYSFRICGNNSETVHLFESAIDLLSYITIQIRRKNDWTREDYISLGGVYVTENKQDIPLAIGTYLERNKTLKTVFLHLGNDTIGIKAAEQIKWALQDRYVVIDRPPESGKDYNDYLKQLIKEEALSIMRIRIFQINLGRDESKVAFIGIDEREHYLGSKEIDSSIYDCVFFGEVECDGLEEVFKKFNLEKPEDYNGRSLSVSDIVEVVDSENVEKGFYYCDNIGFSKVDFNPEEANIPSKNTIKVLMVEPGKKAYEKEIGTSLKELYAALDCDCIQTVYPYDDLVVIVCDDEGKINGGRANRALYDEDGKIMDIICGKFFICDCSTSEFKTLPDDMMAKYKKQFLLPERFCRINDEIIAVKYDPSRGKQNKERGER